MLFKCVIVIKYIPVGEKMQNFDPDLVLTAEIQSGPQKSIKTHSYILLFMFLSLQKKSVINLK